MPTQMDAELPLDVPQPPDKKFDPLRLDILSQNLKNALDQRDLTEFPPRERFAGAGPLRTLLQRAPTALCQPSE